MFGLDAAVMHRVILNGKSQHRFDGTPKDYIFSFLIVFKFWTLISLIGINRNLFKSELFSAINQKEANDSKPIKKCGPRIVRTFYVVSLVPISFTVDAVIFCILCRVHGLDGYHHRFGEGIDTKEMNMTVTTVMIVKSMEITALKSHLTMNLVVEMEVKMEWNPRNTIIVE